MVEVFSSTAGDTTQSEDHESDVTNAADGDAFFFQSFPAIAQDYRSNGTIEVDGPDILGNTIPFELMDEQVIEIQEDVTESFFLEVAGDDLLARIEIDRLVAKNGVSQAGNTVVSGSGFFGSSTFFVETRGFLDNNFLQIKPMVWIVGVRDRNTLEDAKEVLDGPASVAAVDIAHTSEGSDHSGIGSVASRGRKFGALSRDGSGTICQ